MVLGLAVDILSLFYINSRGRYHWLRWCLERPTRILSDDFLLPNRPHSSSYKERQKSGNRAAA